MTSEKEIKQRCLLHEPSISYLVEKDYFDEKSNFQNSLKRKRKHSFVQQYFGNTNAVISIHNDIEF